MDDQNSPGLAINVRGLVKTYHDVAAIDHLDLSVPSGSIFALIGPNGAGKTTTISILTTTTKADKGEARIADINVGLNPEAVRKKIGVTFQEIVLDPDLTGRETMDFHGQLYGLDRQTRKSKTDELLSLVELNEASTRRVKTYSGGMKRRLELARGLMTDPEILFLDEPTQGLDPQNRTNIWQYIRNLKKTRRMTIFLTTHYMEEAEYLADEVAIMDYGKIIISGPPAELIKQMGVRTLTIEGTGNKQDFAQALSQLDFIKDVSVKDDAILISLKTFEDALLQVAEVAQNTCFNIMDIAVSRPSLDDVFLKYTGRRLRDK